MRQELVVYAAGSLRAAFTDFGRARAATEPAWPVRVVFGAAGLLKDRLVAGERADVFASANLAHPEALAAAGRAGAVRRFARNRLCVLAHPEVGMDATNVLAKLLDPAVRVGTSTPEADPAADYTWQMFRRIEARGGAFSGAYAALDRKALQLTGGPASARSPDRRSVYAWLVGTRQADVFITYCTGARQARDEVPALAVVELPDDVNVGVDYGVVRLRHEACGSPSQSAAERFIEALLGPCGQAALARWGFAPA